MHGPSFDHRPAESFCFCGDPVFVLLHVHYRNAPLDIAQTSLLKREGGNQLRSQHAHPAASAVQHVHRKYEMRGILWQ